MGNNIKEYEPWLPFVKMFSKAHALGEAISAVTAAKKPVPPPPKEPKSAGSTVLLCSPHPDDEILTGALPLRLLQEKNATVINLAITLGSDKNRKEARLQELNNACLTAGFQNRLAAYPLAFDQINPTARKQPGWPLKVKIISEILNNIKPDIIFLPHANDNHPTHQGTHFLIMDALPKASLPRVSLIETEFWQPMRNPNLLIGIEDKDLALLLAALSKHKGEISRNPYHLSQPSRMIDNVRRGRELIGSRNGKADFLFGEIYRISLWQSGTTTDIADEHYWSKILPE